MEGYKFRKARSDEGEAIWGIYQRGVARMMALGIEHWDENYPTKELILGDLARNELYVLCDAQTDAPVVAACYNEEQDPTYASLTWRYTDGKAGVIHRLCVDPNAQGKGLGRHAVACLEAEAIAQGASLMRLDTCVKNHIALSLYDSMGYERVGLVNFRADIWFQCFEKRLV